MAITVKSQVELDAALADPTISEITIDSPKYTELKIDDSKGKYIYADGSSTVRAYGSSTVRADGSSTVRAYGSSTVYAYGSSTVRADGSSTVRADGSSTVYADGSSTVRADGSSTVRAYGSSTVYAYGSSTVYAYGSSTVRADGSSTVRADGSSTVYADGSSTVYADGSSTVYAYGSSTVHAGKFASVHLTSKKATVTGTGHVIDMTAIDLNVFADWAEFHGVEVVRGRAIVFKAVNDDLRSPRGFEYPLGKTVTAPDWEPGDFCGSGLHFSPSPIQARYYYDGATRFLKVSVPVKDLSVIDGNGVSTPKLKAKSAKVLTEVTLMGDEITAPVAEVQA
jgi:hypothetical protein